MNVWNRSRARRPTKAVAVTRKAASLTLLLLGGLLLLSSCASSGPNQGTIADWLDSAAPIDEASYRDRVHGSWLATMVANHTGLPVEGIWLEAPGPGDTIELVLLDQWSTDDDTHVEWLDLHILETYGLNPTYEQIAVEWVDHLNGDIWVATKRARELMDEGVVPPATGSPELNPDGAWAMDAQLETELFGLINPGRPDRAREQARFFARVTSSGPAVDASAFYAHMYSVAFGSSDPRSIIEHARAGEPADSVVAPIADAVLTWHDESPDDWRSTRERIRVAYDDDPEWWASRVNFASTIMALLYGDGDIRETLNIAGLAGWDADNNMTTSVGLLGVMVGFDQLPEPFRSATDVYFNEDLSGDLPQFDSVSNIARRTADLGLLNAG